MLIPQIPIVSFIQQLLIVLSSQNFQSLGNSSINNLPQICSIFQAIPDFFELIGLLLAVKLSTERTNRSIFYYWIEGSMYPLWVPSTSECHAFLSSSRNLFPLPLKLLRFWVTDHQHVWKLARCIASCLTLVLVERSKPSNAYHLAL